MKKSFLTLCILILCSSTALAQWTQQDTHFSTASRGIMDICIVNANIVWASAYDGSGSNSSCHDVCVTTDGGTNWTPRTVNNSGSTSIANICAISATEAWTIHYYNNGSGSSDGVYHTTDGGNSWTQQTSAAFSNSASFPDCVWFWDANNGYCMGDPVNGDFEIYTTTNGGSTWTIVPGTNIPNPLSGEFGVVGYQSIVGNTVWFGTNKGRIYKSTDKGLNWTVATCTPIGNKYVSPYFKNETFGLVMDKDVSSFGYLAMTTDGGSSFVPRNNTGPTHRFSMDDIPGSAMTWVTTGADISGNSAGVSYSFDDGATFSAMPLTISTQFLATAWLNDSTGWAGDFNTDATTGGMFKFNGHLVPADFWANNTNIGIGGQVSFQCGVSTGTGATFQWSFPGGNPASSNQKTPPPVTYSSAGQYNVTLTIISDWGTSTKIRNNFVTVSATPPPMVNFTGNLTNINAGGQVQFTDLTTGNPTGWQWSFPGGNPASSNQQNPPPVMYAAAGTYDVILTASNGYGSNTCTKLHYIVVVTPAPPAANFIANATSIIKGASVLFADLSTGGPTTWAWNFQGGTPATYSGSNPPAIYYQLPGQFNVSLTVSNVNGSDTETKVKYITVVDPMPPLTDFYGDKTSINTGETVQFTDISTGGPTAWEWTFEGGSPATALSKYPPAITYSTPGQFSVTLKTTNTFGSNTKTKTGYITVSNAGPPAADFSASKTSVLIGEQVQFTDLSVGNPTVWQWSFEGGTPSYSALKTPDPVTYPSPGVYSVSLYVANQYGSNNHTKQAYITVSVEILPEAHFGMNTNNIIAGHSVWFTDQSTGDPEIYAWSFEGGIPPTSDLKQPDSVLYTTPGVYGVALSVANAFGINTLIIEDLIQVGEIGFEETGLSALLIYPNPASDFLVIRSVKPIREISLVNQFGELVLKKVPENTEVTIPLTQVPSGLYILELTEESGKTFKKIVISK